ncbi:MAG: metal ABC transporter permease [Candidatus Ornithomonoglobus sp.]
MDNIFSHSFMIRAFLAAVMIAVSAPCIGLPIVLKRFSAIGDAASHSALGGIAFGLLIGINPVIGAALFSIAAVLSIEGLRKKFGTYSEIATVVIMSAGIGLTAVLSGFIENGSASINSFMFGSIVAVSDFDLIMTLALSALVVIVTMALYKEIYAITFDEEAAGLCGIPVKAINFILMLLTAVTVSVASRIVGALMISSMLVIPTAAAMLISKSYKQTLIWSIIFAEIFTIAGLFASYYLDMRPGGTIVLIGTIVLVAAAFIRKK